MNNKYNTNIIGALLGGIIGFFAGKEVNKRSQYSNADKAGGLLGAILGWFVADKFKKK